MQRDTTCNDSKIQELIYRKEYKNWDQDIVREKRFIKVLDDDSNANLTANKFYQVYNKHGDYDKLNYCGFKPNLTNDKNKNDEKENKEKDEMDQLFSSDSLEAPFKPLPLASLSKTNTTIDLDTVEALQSNCTLILPEDGLLEKGGARAGSGS